MTSQPLEFFRYGMFLGACLLVSFVAQSVGLVVGAAMNVQVGNALDYYISNSSYNTQSNFDNSKKVRVMKTSGY